MGSGHKYFYCVPTLMYVSSMRKEVPAIFR